MTYQETLDYLYSQLPMFQRVGAAAYRNDLRNIVALCEQLGNPERQFQSIHVAGTNGKGSTSHMLASILQQAGYCVGLYTSPHLKNFTERIRLNGQEIEEEFVIRFTNKVRTSITSISPSFFEVTVAMAFAYFAEKKVDIAVIEVGMGGRLDATNVITPLLSVITNIGYDHQQFLGEILSKIALEKAGIIKTKIPVVISQTQPETENVFRKIAAERQAPIFFADQLVELHEHNTPQERTEFSLRKKDDSTVLIDKIQLDLKGIYQKKNCLGVYVALDVLKKYSHFDFTQGDIRNGLAKVVSNTGLKGRWQVLNSSPLTICDVGHNEDGIRMAMTQLKDYPFDTLRIVLGVANDKDLSKILPLLPSDAVYYFCKANVPRGLDATLLKTQAQTYQLKGNSYASVQEALQQASKEAAEKDLVFVGGSVFVVAEVV